MTGAKFERLVQIMSTLRGPDGCPWDKEQNLDSLKPMLIEEVYEVIEAIDDRDYDGLSEELGDVLLHVVFEAQLGREMEKFTIDDVIDGICDKLVRRHPHVFGDESAEDAEQVVENWEAIKTREKEGRDDDGSAPGRSLLEGIPRKLPALHEAHKISSRVARVGFDWPEIDAVFEKLQEEIQELHEAIAQPEAERSREELENEIGDTMFVLVNIARFLDLDTESSLKRANRKFRARFNYIEKELKGAGKTLEESTLAEMEASWQRAKRHFHGPE
jgi:MazG family protein